MTDSTKIRPCITIGDTLVLYDHSTCLLKDESRVGDIIEALTRASFIDLLSLQRVAPPTRPVEIVLVGGRGSYLVRTNEYLGFTVSRDANLVIIPKVFKEQDPREGLIGFLRMLGIVFDMDLKFKAASAAINDAGDAGIFEVILYLYGRMLEAELLRGAYRHYVRRVGEERFARGKLLISKQVRKPPTRAHLFSVEYYSFSINNPLNKVLKTAAYLGAEIAKNNKTRIMLGDVVALLKSVDLVRNVDAETKKVHFNRLNLRFKPIYQLAKIIIHGLRPLRGERTYGFFIAQSEIVFQHLVYKTLVSRLSKLRKNCAVRYEQKQEWVLVRQLYPNERSYVQQVPDIDVQCGNSRTFVDVKYKDISDKGRPDENDLRQLYVYARILEKETGIKPVTVFLVYPYLEGSFNADIFERHLFIVYKYLQRKSHEDTEEPCLIVTRYNMGNLIKNGEPYDYAMIELIANSMKITETDKQIKCLVELRSQSH